MWTIHAHDVGQSSRAAHSDFFESIQTESGGNILMHKATDKFSEPYFTSMFQYFMFLANCMVKKITQKKKKPFEQI